MRKPTHSRRGQVFWPALLVAAVVFLAFLVNANAREPQAAAPAPVLQPRMYFEQLDANGAVALRREVSQFTFADGTTSSAADLFASGRWSTTETTSIGVEIGSGLRVVWALR